ncbi:hypothetical protein Tdes44962_MAKER00035 [Teratosphaeria destructans]|uniref:Uncharacterized protein n=1 Tax=Teratosphaeria destructans TaxID=418781 RepID=A0A9W7W8C4_9PEZI|nr:hypothetical protein Tdes44962_MAKER00035 [Teratosphaeria destructans]
MDPPPPYDEPDGEYNQCSADVDVKHEKPVQMFSIHEEFGAFRSQRVAELVEKVLPQVRDRAQSGLAKTTLLLLPSGQDTLRRGILVGFSDDEIPIIIQLEGRHDSLEFWSQKEALSLLRDQLLASLDGLPNSRIAATPPLPPRSPMRNKSSFFSRKQAKAPQEPPKMAEAAKAPVMVEVMLDVVNFRGENDFGLYETLQEKAVLVRVEVS